MTNSIYHAEGSEARLRGRPFSACPYSDGGYRQKCWREGWFREDKALHLGCEDLALRDYSHDPREATYDRQIDEARGK